MNLAVFDSLFLIYVSIEGFARGIQQDVKLPQPNWPTWAIPYYPWIIYPLKYMLPFMTIYMVVVVSIERFQAIVYPLYHRPSCWPYVLFVVLTGVTITIPCFFHYESIHDKNGNISGYKEYILGLSKAYRLFFEVFLIIIGTFGPFVCILFCNICIFWTLKKSKVKQSKKNKSAKILFSIVVVFLLAHICRLINSGIVFFNPITAKQTKYCNSIGKLDRPVVGHLFSSLINCMLAINSSCNFLLYCLTGSAFRQELKQLFTEWRTKMKSFL